MTYKGEQGGRGDAVCGKIARADPPGKLELPYPRSAAGGRIHLFLGRLLS